MEQKNKQPEIKQPNMKMRNNLFLLRAYYPCHACHQQQLVAALGTSDLYDDEYGWLPTNEDKSLYILSEVYSTPPEIVQLVRSAGVVYGQRKNSVGNDTYFANWCANCGALFRDLYLVGLPRGPFLPETVEAARAIEILEIPLASELEFECAYSQGYGELIRQHARPFRNLGRLSIDPSDDSQW